MKFGFFSALIIFLIFISALVFFSNRDLLLSPPADDLDSQIVAMENQLITPFGDSFSSSDLAQAGGASIINCVQPAVVPDNHKSVAKLSAGIFSGPKDDAKKEVLRLLDEAKLNRNKLEPTFKCGSGCERKNTKAKFTIVSYPVSDKICNEKGTSYTLPIESFSAKGSDSSDCQNNLLKKVADWTANLKKPDPNPCKDCSFHSTILSNHINIDSKSNTCSIEITVKNVCWPHYEGKLSTNFNFNVLVEYSWSCVPVKDGSAINPPTTAMLNPNAPSTPTYSGTPPTMTA